MSMYSLTNIPHKDAKREIESFVCGESIEIFSRSKGDTPDAVNMGSVFIGKHMFDNPLALRELIGREIVAAIEVARRAGYHQAQEDMRRVLGVPA